MSWILRAIVLFVAGTSLCACAERHPSMSIDSPSIRTGSRIGVVFDRPIDGRATNQYWMSLSKKGSPDGEFVASRFLFRQMTGDFIEANEPGEFELRLHAHYPAREAEVVQRIPVRVAD